MVSEMAPATRSFRMGFTDWSYGTTATHQDETWQLIRKHGDLICLQFDDGVPWREAYEGRPYHKSLQAQIDSRLQRVRPEDCTYVQIGSLNMTRDDIAGSHGAEDGMPRPGPWAGYAIDDEPMVTAYVNFCDDLITRFQPTWVNYGLETTEYLHTHPENWAAYVAFHEGVYGALKARHPNVPLGVSMPLKHPGSQEAGHLHTAVVDLLPAVDFIAASVYPFAFFGHDDAGDPANLPERWIEQFFDAARGKPIAIGETNWIAKDLDVPVWGLRAEGRPEWQERYAELLLSACNERNALFVIWWSIADYLLKWDGFSDDVKDLGKIWRDTGLLDESLNPRPSLATWDRWLTMPVEA